MFATMMSLVLHMCILISCSSVLCVLMALGLFMFVRGPRPVAFQSHCVGGQS